MFYSPCSFSSSALTKKFGSDQIGVGPQRLPHLLSFTEDGRITCHPSVCTCSPVYLSILFFIRSPASPSSSPCRLPFFHVFILSSFRLSFCSAVWSKNVLKILSLVSEIWSTNVKNGISEHLSNLSGSSVDNVSVFVQKQCSGAGFFFWVQCLGCNSRNMLRSSSGTLCCIIYKTE